MKLGEAPVSDAAADVLTVTIGSGPVTIDRALDDSAGLKKKVAKAFDPEQPRDWRERLGESDFAKFNPHHDEKGRFTTADGAKAPDKENREAKPNGVQLAGALSELLGHMVPPFVGGSRPRQREENQNPSLTDPPPPSFPSSSPDDPKDMPPPAATDAPREPASAAGAPAIPPDDQGDNEEQPRKKFTVPDREPSIDNPEDRKLGWDSDTKKFRPNEVKTAWRLQEVLQEPLERSSGGGDWVAPDGKVYDAAGPAPKEFFNIDEFSASIDRHLLKSGITPVIDVTGMSAEQVEQIDNYIAGLPPEERAKILKIGF